MMAQKALIILSELHFLLYFLVFLVLINNFQRMILYLDFNIVMVQHSCLLVA